MEGREKPELSPPSLGTGHHLSLGAVSPGALSPTTGPASVGRSPGLPASPSPRSSLPEPQRGQARAGRRARTEDAEPTRRTPSPHGGRPRRPMEGGGREQPCPQGGSRVEAVDSEMASPEGPRARAVGRASGAAGKLGTRWRWGQTHRAQRLWRGGSSRRGQSGQPTSNTSSPVGAVSPGEGLAVPRLGGRPRALKGFCFSLYKSFGGSFG